VYTCPVWPVMAGRMLRIAVTLLPVYTRIDLTPTVFLSSTFKIVSLNFD
jgi:hypothetical protein